MPPAYFTPASSLLSGTWTGCRVTGSVTGLLLGANVPEDDKREGEESLTLTSVWDSGRLETLQRV